MHVVVDGRVITPHFPGIGRYAYRLTEALSAAAPEDRFTVLLTEGQRDDRFDLAALGRAPNLRRATVRAPVFSLATQWRVPPVVRSLAADVLHATYWLPPLRPGAPLVLSVYDLIGLQVRGAVPAARRLPLALALRLALRSAAAIVTLSEWSRTDIVRRFDLAPERVVVTPLAAEAAFRPPAADAVAELRHRLGLPDRYVLYCGINKPHKNLSTLVAAWGRLAPSLAGGDTALVLAGRWDRRYDALRAEIAALGPSAPARVLGPVAEADLPALLGGAAVFAFPSRYEGFGLPPLEAMACGAPVVAAAASSLPEVVGDAGLLVDPDDVAGWRDALGAVLGDPARAEQLRAAGLARAAVFTWRATAERTLLAYRMVRRA
jgi:alpha-1,3-rhamnosyl/mannosyltransferase